MSSSYTPNLASPGPIGNTTPGTVKTTNLIIASGGIISSSDDTIRMDEIGDIRGRAFSGPVPAPVWEINGIDNIFYLTRNTKIIWGTSLFSGDVVITSSSAGVLTLTDNGSGSGYIRTVPVIVASLPSAATAGAGAKGFVSDGSTTVVLGLGLTVIGGGANKVPVYSDGTNWIVG